MARLKEQIGISNLISVALGPVRADRAHYTCLVHLRERVSSPILNDHNRIAARSSGWKEMGKTGSSS